jgi:hypothetical protein
MLEQLLIWILALIGPLSLPQFHDAIQFIQADADAVIIPVNWRKRMRKEVSTEVR